MELFSYQSHQKDLCFNVGTGFSNLNAWELLDLFDYETINTNTPYIFYNPETRTFNLNEAGVYRIDYSADIETDAETSIFYKLRLNIDGVGQSREFLCETSWDQLFTQNIEIFEPLELQLEIYAITEGDLVIRSKAGESRLLITKVL